MSIKGITEQRILPRLGKIRTGAKAVSQKGNEYPVELEHFVLNPIEEILDKNGAIVGHRENEHILGLIKLFGEKPHELKVAFPVDNNDMIFAHHMKWWGGNVSAKKATLMCKGDGEWASYRGKEHVSGLDSSHYPYGMNRICNPEICPQAQKQGDKPSLCKANMNLMFLVPTYSMYGVFQLDTTSVQAIRNVVSCIEVARNALRLEGIPTIAGVPLRLFRKRTPNIHGGVNYIIHIEVDQTELRIQKQQYLDKKPSSLGIGIESYHIDFNLLDEPNYDLLPKSDFPNHLQTGEVPMLDAPVDIVSLVEDEEISALFDQIASARGVPATKAKKEATAKNHPTKEDLKSYLLDQISKMK